MPKIDWSVLARQVALIAVPLIIARLKLPPSLAQAVSGPLVELVSGLLVILGGLIVTWVVVIGQKREQPKEKIEAVAALPAVAKVEVKSEALAQSIPNPKVVA